MRLRQEANVLKGKAVASFVVATAAFNSPHDIGRATQVLLCLQHAFEMLLKAALVQARVGVFDKRTGRSKGFEACIRLAEGSTRIKLRAEDAGLLRAIDAMRDDEQHWFNKVSEQLLYLHARAAITLFDELLQRVFSERLTDHVPQRVLPLSVDAPQDLALLLDDEYSQIQKLLVPDRRAGHQARARIRTFLAMEGHVTDDAHVSSKDVDRVERAIKRGEVRSAVFPRLDDVSTAVDGEGVTLKVHFTKKHGPPVRYEPNTDVEAAAVREVDLQAKYHLSPTELASGLGLTVPRSAALRKHLGIDEDPNLHHVFRFGKSRHQGFSDRVAAMMRPVAQGSDMAAIWEAHKPSGGSTRRGPCQVEGCQAVDQP